jgi:cytidylate kinase
MKDSVIAIDGPAASGKSSAAGLVAEKLKIPYINTGNMYRAITFTAMQKGFQPGIINQDTLIEEILQNTTLEYVEDSEGKLKLELNGKQVEAEIRTPEVAKHVSLIAAIPEVRAWLIENQRKFADKGMIVMEGRDIGTVVFPNARFKFFLTAFPEVRAERRLNQDGETTEEATVQSVAAEIAQRDKMDMTRKVAPLREAEDAVHIDSSNMTLTEVVDFIIDKIKKEIRNA